MSATRDVKRFADREGYHEMPSVRIGKGGSAVFYYRRCPRTDHRQWIVRRDGSWIHQDENPQNGSIVEFPFWTTRD